MFRIGDTGTRCCYFQTLEVVNQCIVTQVDVTETLTEKLIAHSCKCKCYINLHYDI